MSTSTIPNDRLTEILDDIEGRLPAIPAKSFQLTRATARRANAVVTAVAEDIVDRYRSIASVTSTATNTVTGQARSAADRSAAAVRKGVAETTGQARSAADRSAAAVRKGVAETTGQARYQATRVAESLENETEDLLDDATDAVDPKRTNPASLNDLTKAELYERAQELDIDGRSTMSKKQLVAALRNR